MAGGSLLIDSNLLVLLVVGETDRNLVRRHRRLTMFREGDFERLLEFIGEAEAVCVTPNTLTETSNLLPYGVQSQRFELFRTLQQMIEERFVEVVVPSDSAARRSEFAVLGLTDAVLLELLSSERRLLTIDVDLYLMAASLEPNAVISFAEGTDRG